MQNNKKNAPIHLVNGEYITEYLILGPFFPDDLSTDFLADVGGEASIEPKEGDTATTPDGRHLVWKRYESRTDIINLLDAFGIHDQATAYAFCSVRAENAIDVAFNLRNEAGIAIWINGKRVYSCSDPRDLLLDSGLFEARLVSGVNRCLVKVTRLAMHWGFAMRALPPTRAVISGVVTDEDQKPSPDVEVCLEQCGQPLALAKTDTSGKYRLGVYPVSGTYDISAIQDRMGTWQLGLQLSEGENRTLNLELREAGSIEGRLLMLDNETGHAAVPVQVLHNGKVVATTLSDRYGESGRYEFSNLKPGDYQLRCQVLRGYVYYQQEGKGEARERESGAILHVEADKTLRNVDFHFAPFKKGTWRNYTCLDGLPHIEVRVIYRDPDGVMWFGTRGGGVARYDGREFVNFTIRDGLVSNRVRAIYQSPKGIMWFGTENGISRYDGSEFVNFTTADGLVDNRVWDICRDADGVIWFGTHGGVSRYDGESFFNFTTEDGLAGNNVMTVHCDSDGLMWFATSSGVSRYDGEKFVNLTFADGFIDQRVNSLCRDTEGMIWFATETGISRYDGKELVNFTSEEDGLVDNNVRSVCCDSDGAIWLGILGGISRYDGKTFVNFTTPHGLPNDGVCGGVYCDPDGALWAGTYYGVARYDEQTFVSFTMKD
ncbi:carboxypeptidase regulatory-like domain-containing protein, partial [bacterium]|nr:carboxypeptidase regulatory-like domain-containing protein [bacterium]